MTEHEKNLVSWLERQGKMGGALTLVSVDAERLVALVRRLAARVEELHHYASELTGLVVVDSQGARNYAVKHRDAVFGARTPSEGNEP